jgi:heme oxygenase
VKAAPPAAAQQPLSRRLRERTAPLHRLAERAGVAPDMLHGRIARPVYALLLRNLLPVYRALEDALQARCDSPLLAPFATPALYRAAALESDLDALAGAAWRESLAWLPAGRRYAQRVGECAGGDGARLLGHAYVRYLGDLSGGQLLGARLARALGVGADALCFYRFPAIADLGAFKTGYRSALDRSAALLADADEVVEEAALAFRLNIALFENVQAAAA